MRRHGVGNLRDLQAQLPRPKHKAFKAYEPDYLHVDVKYLPQMADESSRRYLFVAIDRATRWVFIRICKFKTAANARRYLRDLERACPMRIRTILMDYGREFTDRLFGLRKRAATGQHAFHHLCSDLGTDHRLTPPQHPRPTASSSASRDAQKTCCKATTSAPARSWKPRCTATSFAVLSNQCLSRLTLIQPAASAVSRGQ